MRGIELMMMSIAALGNVTVLRDSGTVIKHRWKKEVEDFGESPSDVHSASLEEEALPDVIKIATLEAPPHSSVVMVNGTLKGQGYAFEVLQLIASNLDIRYEIVQPKSPGLGNDQEGIIGLLKEQEIDMAVAFIPMLWKYSDFTRFSPTLDEADIVALMMRPAESAVGSGLLAPFDTTVWICILISLLIVGPVVYAFTSFRSYLWNRTKVDKYDFTSCVWFTYGALLKQGSSITPVNNSTRLVFATWWIFITILTSFYTANLTAFLTLSQFTLPYKSVEDIVKKKVFWLFENDRTIDNILDTGHGNVIEELAKSPYRRRIDRESPTDALTAYTLFLGERDLIEQRVFEDYTEKTTNNLEQSKRCPYVTVPSTLYQIPRAFMYQKDSKIQKFFDKQLQTLIEVGIIKYLETKDLPRVKYCPLNLKTTDRQLKNSDLSLTYKVIAAGFVTACVVFICEMIRRRRDVSCLCCRKACRCCWSRLQTPKVLPHTTPPVPHTNGNFQLAKASRSGPIVSSNSINNWNRNVGKNGLQVGKNSPIYESVYGDGTTAKKANINGRDYWVITEPKGDKRLIPIRTPSALLFQYTT